MKDTTPQRAELLMHLEAAVKIAEELGQSVCAYLAERALDEAKSANWRLDVKLRDFKSLLKDVN